MKGIKEPISLRLLSIIIFIFLINICVLGLTKGSINKAHGKTRKIQVVKFGHYHLDLIKHPDNVYAVHICCDAENRFRLGSGFISMSLKTWDDFIKHTCARLNMNKYDSLLFLDRVFYF